MKRRRRYRRCWQICLGIGIILLFAGLFLPILVMLKFPDYGIAMAVGGVILIVVSLIFYEEYRLRSQLPSSQPENRKLWMAGREKIDIREFNDTRRCLLNSYNSSVQTHAALVIALALGLLTLVSSFRSFFDIGLGWAFWLIIFLVAGASIYMILRIIYWTSYATLATEVPLDDTIRVFNKVNLENESRNKGPLYEEPLYTTILSMVIWEKMKEDKAWYKRLAIKASRN